MMEFKGLVLRAMAASGLENFFAPPAQSRLTTLVMHGFAHAGESWSVAKDRLCRQLEWMRGAYTPVSLSQVEVGLESGKLPQRPLLVTIDDALVDLLEVADVFRSFEVPPAVFVCAGWTVQASVREPIGLLAGIVSAIEWYRGPEVKLTMGPRNVQLLLSTARRGQAVDDLLTPNNGLLDHLDELADKLQAFAPRAAARSICTWDELRLLQTLGVDIGCHSVSHIRMATATPMRRAFEIGEGKRLVESQLGACSAFAYPYGTADAHNEASAHALGDAGFRLAFLTHSDFSSTASDPYRLPRITLPDRAMALAEFRARVRGAGIPLAKAKAWVRGARPNVA